MEGGNPAIRTLLFLVLLMINGVFSGNEAAYGELNESRVQKKAEEGNKKAARVLKILQAPGNFRNAAALVVTSVAMIAGAFIVHLFYTMARDAVWAGFSQVDPKLTAAVTGIVITAVLIFVILIFGTIVPRKIGAKYSEKWALSTVGIIRFFMIVLCPFTKFMMVFSGLIVRIFGVDPKDDDENLTEEEIMQMVSEGHEQGVLEASEAKMIGNIMEFDEKEVSDIMTHRRKIVGVDVDMNVEQAAALILNERFSRYPVYEGDIENIIGILYQKDILRAMLEGDRKQLDIRAIMREPFFVTDTQSLSTLFKAMQQKKVHMAVVIDEYGQTAGIVAMEDILEEIVGNIFDEYDLDECEFQKIGVDTWLMKGTAALEDVSELLGVDFEEEEFDTLNGLLISRLERIPAESEHPSLTICGWLFKVKTIKNNIIEEVYVIRVKDELGLASEGEK